MTTLKKSIFINAPVEKVHNIAIDPNNLPLYYENLSAPESTTGDGGPGTISTYTYTMLGMKVPVTTKIIECNLTPEGCITKIEISGGYTATQIATGIPIDNGTEITFEIQYTLPGSIFGKLADKLLVEKMEESSLEHTLQSLKVLCENE